MVITYTFSKAIIQQALQKGEHFIHCAMHHIQLECTAPE